MMMVMMMMIHTWVRNKRWRAGKRRGGQSYKGVGCLAHCFAGGCVWKVKNVGLCLENAAILTAEWQSREIENSWQHSLKRCKRGLSLKTSCMEGLQMFLGGRLFYCPSSLILRFIRMSKLKVMTRRSHHSLWLSVWLSVRQWWDSITWETLWRWSPFYSRSWSELSLSQKSTHFLQPLINSF